MQSDWLNLRIKRFERGLPCHFTKIAQNSDTVAYCFFTFSCQEANTLTDTKFSCKRIAEVGIIAAKIVQLSQVEVEYHVEYRVIAVVRKRSRSFCQKVQVAGYS